MKRLNFIIGMVNVNVLPLGKVIGEKTQKAVKN
jgi:hypothetical protein